MPMGLNQPVVGYCTYFGIKIAGYTAAAAAISHEYKRTDRNPLLVGAVRTMIGVAVGAAYFGAWALVPPPDHDIGLIYYAIAGLIPVRFAEWWLLIWIFYDRGLLQPKKGWKTVASATAWSFLLDLPAIFGFIMTAGLWIC